MAGNDDAGVLDTLLAEKDMLVSSIVSGGGGGGHATTVEALGEFLIRFSISNEGRIPFLRTYQPFPDWQRQSGLLQENWDKDVPQETAKVIFTLITSQRRSISRKSFGGGTWKSTGAEIIGRDEEEVVLSKLYYKRDTAITSSPRPEFTVFEFRRKMMLQPKVAIWVLHRKGYTGCIPDLKKYTRQGWFPGGYQSSLETLQPPQTIYTDSYAAGFMACPHVAYNNNLAYNSETNILGANQVYQMEVQHEGQYLDSYSAGFMTGPHVAYTNNLPYDSETNILGANQVWQIEVQHKELYSDPYDAGFRIDVTNPVPNNETCYGEPLIHSSLEAPPPPSFLVDIYKHLFSENNSMDEFGGKHSHVDGLAMLKDFYSTLNETMTTELLEPLPQWDDLL